MCSNLFEFHLFADDANLFYKHNNLNTLQYHINTELIKVHEWLCANKLLLSIEKSNFVLFHPPQKKINSNFQLTINNVPLRQDSCIKYLGIYIDSNLTCKSHIDYIAKKVKRSIGILSKLRYYVDNRIIINLYYALIYPFLIYGMIVWGSTYHTNVQPLFISQKKLYVL